MRSLVHSEQCSKCGTCMACCPSYKHFHEESASPRGRVELCAELDKGTVRLPAVAALAVERCLVCLRCVSSCPSRVRVDAVVRGAAASVYSRGIGGLMRRAVFRGLLPHRPVFREVIRAVSRAQNVLGLRGRALRHLPLFPWKGRLPQLAIVDAARRLSEEKPAAANKGPTTAVFLGCLVNYVYPDVAVDAVAALRRIGLNVVVPRGQTCCGVPAWVTGDDHAARRVARSNVRALLAEGPQMIVTVCASCGRMLKETYPELLGEPTAHEFAARVQDATELLSMRGEKKAVLRSADNEIIAYHRPCHARWYDSVGVAERLSACLGTEIFLLPDSCCGGAGTFSLRLPDAARAIARPTVEAVRRRGVTTVLTPCPGCIMQLRELFREENIDVQVRHPVAHLTIDI